VPDNSTINTLAIQAAIDTAAAAPGGGIVLVPAGGAFKTATVSLASGVFLYLPRGAVLHGSSALEDYVAVNGGEWGRWDVVHTNNATDTGVIGDAEGGAVLGTISGPAWQLISSYDPVNNQLQPVTWAGIAPYNCEGECRPRNLVFEDCVGVTVSNVALVDSADWTQLYRRTARVLLANMSVWGSQQWPNNDSVDLESCADVTIVNYTSFTGDDGVVLASGNTNNLQHPWPEPAGRYSPTLNVLVENATISSYSSGIKFEAIFQASHGDVYNVTVRDVLIHDSARGIGFQQRTGTGAFANIVFEDVEVVRTKSIQGPNWWGCGEALWMTSLPESQHAAPMGGIHNVSFVNVVLEGEQGALVISRDQGNASSARFGPGISGIEFSNTSVVVGVFGNATRPGVHDFRPTDPGALSPPLLQANVTGWWFEHASGVTIRGGSVSFRQGQPPEPFWVRGVCIEVTSDSEVHVKGMGCSPATMEE
jgi:polygalacturonase